MFFVLLRNLKYMERQHVREETFNEALKRRVGRPLVIETPEDLIRESESYFEWCDNNPYLDEDFVGKDATTVVRKRRRPYLLIELATWLGMCGIEGLFHYKYRKEFFNAYSHVEGKIVSNQVSGAAAGHFNSNFVARLNGINDNTNLISHTTHAVAPETVTELATVMRNLALKAADGMPVQQVYEIGK